MLTLADITWLQFDLKNIGSDSVLNHAELGVLGISTDKPTTMFSNHKQRLCMCVFTSVKSQCRHALKIYSWSLREV